MCVYEYLLHPFSIEQNANAVAALAAFFRRSGRQNSTTGLAPNLVRGLFQGNCRRRSKLGRLICLIEKIGRASERTKGEYKQQPQEPLATRRTVHATKISSITACIVPPKQTLLSYAGLTVLRWGDPYPYPQTSTRIAVHPRGIGLARVTIGHPIAK